MEVRASGPTATLSVTDAIAVIVGVVVGAGIFKTPALVAASSGSAAASMLAWVLGGLISLIGALCYAELATTFPHAGGDYHYLHRAFGVRFAFFFAWARIAVIQTGSITMQAFLVGDYVSSLRRLGEHSTSIYAALVVLGVTVVNMWRVRGAAGLQRALTAATLAGLFLVVAVGFALSPAPSGAPPAPPSSPPAFGLAMVFVLLTYGGWNEAAYLSAELRQGRRAILRALAGSIGLVTALYLLVNVAYLRGLGLAGTRGSEAVAADLLAHALGAPGVWLITLVIAIAALSTINATVFTGARTTYALGRDVRALAPLGRWSVRSQTPRNALLAQAAVALALVLLGTWTRHGFVTMVEYTAPVFWFFFVAVGVSFFVLRRKERDRPRPFRVPLYPLTPIALCLAGLYMLASSVLYTGVGALVGIAVLLSGVPFLWAAKREPRLGAGRLARRVQDATQNPELRARRPRPPDDPSAA